jgi:serine/threonine protein kinase
MTSTEFTWNNYIIRNGSIGKGSFSKVYYGYHKDTKVEIAMKKIQFTSLQNSVKDKVISEISILQKMDHPNIMKLYEHRFDGEYIVLITEYCNEKDIGTWMKADHTIEETVSVIKQILSGVQYMHRNNILHRDIKPENILLHNGVVKICDFGFSTIIKEHHQLMRTICGTPLFMSPELLFMKPYTMKSDIWSLGILFYLMCYTIHPFGMIESLDDYRIKIKRAIIYVPIEEAPYIVTMISTMLTYDAENRPDIELIMDRIEMKTEIINEIVAPVRNEDLSRTQLLERINELECDIFEMEERSEQTSSCCFGKSPLGSSVGSTKSPAITGRGHNQKGYDVVINNYFTPPELQLGSASDSSRRTPSTRSCSIQSKSSSSSFLSSSIEKISAFFSFGKNKR